MRFGIHKAPRNFLFNSTSSTHQKTKVEGDLRTNEIYDRQMCSMPCEIDTGVKNWQGRLSAFLLYLPCETGVLTSENAEASSGRSGDHVQQTQQGDRLQRAQRTAQPPDEQQQQSGTTPCDPEPSCVSQTHTQLSKIGKIIGKRF